jgi:hypothetical protein
MSRHAFGRRLALALLLVSVTGWATDGGGSPDGASLQQELAELERTRQEFDALAKQLDEQRAILEKQTEAARAGQNLIFVVGGVAIVVLIAGGLAWAARSRQRGKPNVDQSSD